MGGVAVRGDEGAGGGVDGEDAGHAANAESIFDGIQDFVEVFAGVDEVGEGVDVETLVGVEVFL